MKCNQFNLQGSFINYFQCSNEQSLKANVSQATINRQHSTNLQHNQDSIKVASSLEQQKLQMERQACPNSKNQILPGFPILPSISICCEGQNHEQNILKSTNSSMLSKSQELDIKNSQQSAQLITAKEKCTPEERHQKIQKYLEKRKRRTYDRKISYDCRKKVADSRVRIKGRFVNKKTAEMLLNQNGKKEVLHDENTSKVEEQIQQQNKVEVEKREISQM